MVIPVESQESEVKGQKSEVNLRFLIPLDKGSGVNLIEIGLFYVPFQRQLMNNRT
jgi:hypothetical protein